MATEATFVELREALRSAQAEVESYERAREEEIDGIARKAQGELAQAKAELGALQARLDTQAVALGKEREVAALERAHAELQPTIERLRREATSNVEALRVALRRYERFGLTFEGTSDGALRLRFRRIDAREPDREFAVSVVVNDNDLYEVRDTFPSLKSQRLATLVERVNKTNDFGLFVRSLRLEFQATVRDK